MKRDESMIVEQMMLPSTPTIALAEILRYEDLLDREKKNDLVWL
ncbi:hypothetical protein [Sphingobacterium pedocola]|nr:hypothetical protein [Sphingobacterium pedocola]